MINVCFGLHDADGKYSKFVGATMVSIFENLFTPPNYRQLRFTFSTTRP